MTRAIRLSALALLIVAGAAGAGEAPVESDAKVVHRETPKYPAAAAKRSVEGCVTVGFDVGADGLADHYVVLDSQPAGVFDQASLKALKGWRWEKDKPGHQTQNLEYRMDPHREVSEPPKCKATVAAPALQELQVLQKTMPNLAGLARPEEGGCVTARMLIKHDGFVGEVAILEAKPPALAEPAAAALKQWWFQSFAPPDRTTVQTFYFTPDQVHLPDNAARSPYLALSADGSVKNAGCGVGTSGARAKPGTQG